MSNENSPQHAGWGDDKLLAFLHENEVPTEKHLAVRALHAHVAAYLPDSLEVKPVAARGGRDFSPDTAGDTVLHAIPRLATEVVTDEILSLKGDTADGHGLTDEDVCRVREFWAVYAGNELNVWCSTLNSLSDGRAADEQQQGEDCDTFHLGASALELLALERIEFFFGKLYHAVGGVDLEYFQDQLSTLVDRECWVEHLRDVTSKQQQVH